MCSYWVVLIYNIYEMSDERLAKKLKDIMERNTAVMNYRGREINDNEKMHSDADDAILEFLEDNGYTESAEQYREMKKYFWYA